MNFLKQNWLWILGTLAGGFVLWNILNPTQEKDGVTVSTRGSWIAYLVIAFGAFSALKLFRRK